MKPKNLTCPVVDNAYGRGVLGNGEAYGWWVTASCPLHGANTTGEDNPERIKLEEKWIE